MLERPTTGVAVTLNLQIDPGAAYRVLDVFLKFLAGDAALTRRDFGLQLVAFRRIGSTALLSPTRRSSSYRMVTLL